MQAIKTYKKYFKNKLNLILVVFACFVCTSFCFAQHKFKIKQNIPLDSIRLSDPYILANIKTKTYYLTGTGGMLWKSKNLKSW